MTQKLKRRSFLAAMGLCPLLAKLPWGQSSELAPAEMPQKLGGLDNLLSGCVRIVAMDAVLQSITDSDLEIGDYVRATDRGIEKCNLSVHVVGFAIKNSKSGGMALWRAGRWVGV